MGDTHDSLLPPSSGDFAPATPSGLTPNTRSEAEAALTLNSSFQTESAAPTTPLPSHSDSMQPYIGAGDGNESVDGTDEAQKAYNRPGPIRTSSANYEKALREARKQSASSSTLSPTVSTDSTSILDENKVASPVTTTTPFPAPGQGVVPLHPPIGKGQSDVIKKAKPDGMTLGTLGRQPSFKEQDIKHVYASNLMVPVKDDPGYNSGTEETTK